MSSFSGEPYSTTATLCYDADFYPFGGERPYTNNCSQAYKFTGKERDAESNLDHFEARYYSSATGRFMSPDPGNMGAIDDSPQTWNMYSYVANNPMNATDPDGLDCVYLSDMGTSIEYVDTNSNLSECQDNGGYWADGSFVAAWKDPSTGDLLIETTDQNGDTGLTEAGFGSTGGTPWSSQTQWTPGSASNSPGGSSDESIDPFGRAVLERLNQMPMQRFIGVVYVGSVAVGAAGGAICSVACDGASALNMGGDYGERLIATAQDANGKNVGESILNRMMSLDQRRLLVQYFDTGELPEGLTERSLQIYKEIAQRTIAAGRDEGLNIQETRLTMIDNALKLLK